MARGGNGVVMLELYKNIKRRRIELGMTQDELAKLTGYTDRSSITKIEAGKVDLPQSKIMQFAEVLNVSPTALLGWEDDGHYDNDDTLEIAKQMMDNEELHALFRAAKDSDPEDIEAVYNMLLALKRKEHK